MGEGSKPLRYAVAVFDGFDGLEHASHALDQTAQGPLETSILARQPVLEGLQTLPAGPEGRLRGQSAGRPDATPNREIGSDQTKVGLLNIVEVGAIVRSDPVSTSAGVLADLLLQGGAGPGKSIGAVLRAWMPEKHSRFLEEQIGNGKLLLWVQIADPDHEAAVCRVLLEHSPYRVQVHDLGYRSRGR